MLAYDIYTIPINLNDYNSKIIYFEEFKLDKNYYNKYYIEANNIIRTIKLNTILK